MSEECGYNKSFDLMEKEFKFFRHKKIYLTVSKIEPHAIELAWDTKFIRNWGHFEIYCYIALFKISFTINMHDVRVG